MTGINFNDDGKLKSENRNENEEIVDMVWGILSNNAGDSNREKYNAVSNIIRNWTTNDTTNGAYRGVPYFTLTAYEKYKELWEEHDHQLVPFSKVLGKYFKHEHILPVAAAVRLFDSRNEIARSTVQEVLYNHVNAAVVTIDEAKLLDGSTFKDKMPKSFYDTGNIFERYEAVGLQLLYVVWNEGNKEIAGEPKVVDMQLDVIENHVKHAMEDVAEQINTNLLDFITQGMAQLEADENLKKRKSNKKE